MAEQRTAPVTATGANCFKEAVCIDAGRIYDSCTDKDCLTDLQVFFTAVSYTHLDVYKRQIQAFVPEDLLDGYKAAMEAVFGANHCHVLSIRPVGGVDLCAL